MLYFELSKQPSKQSINQRKISETNPKSNSHKQPSSTKPFCGHLLTPTTESTKQSPIPFIRNLSEIAKNLQRSRKSGFLLTTRNKSLHIELTMCYTNYLNTCACVTNTACFTGFVEKSQFSSRLAQFCSYANHDHWKAYQIR